MNRQCATSLHFFKLFVITLVSFVFFSQTVQASEIRKSCLAFFAQLEPSPLDMQPKQVPGFWATLFTWGWKQREAAIEFNERIETLKNELKESQSDAETAIRKLQALTSNDALAKELIHPHHVQLIRTHLDQAMTLVKNGRRSIDVLILHDVTMTHYRRLIKESTNWKEAVLANIGDVQQLFEAAPVRFRVKYTSERLKRELQEIAKIISIEDLRAHFQALKESLEGQIADFNSTEKTRRERELRFDLKVKESSPKILDVFLDLVDQMQIETIREKMVEGKAQTLTSMEKSPEFKKFIYNELQIARHLLQSKNSETLAILKMRQLNNATIIAEFNAGLESHATESTQKLMAAMGLRKQIRLLSKTAVFAKTALKDSIKRLPTKLQEKIFSDAMSNHDLANVILTSAISIPAILEKPMVKPTKPVRPTKLETNKRGYKRYDRYTNESRKRQNKSAMNNYVRAKEQFVRDVARYNQRLSDYKASVEKARVTEARRRGARESLFAYIIEKYPEVIPATTASGMTRDQVIALAKDSQRKIITSRMARAKDSWRSSIDQQMARRNGGRSNFTRPSEYYRENTIYNSHDSSMDWLMMLWTGNPMWVISPTIAKFQLFMDIVDGNHLRGSSQHFLAAGYSHIAEIPVDRERAAGNIENYMNLERDSFIEAAGATVEAQKLDSDARLGGLTGVDIRNNIELNDRFDFNRIVDEVERQQGTLDTIQNGSGNLIDGTIKLNDDWNRFLSESDADWVDSKTDQLDTAIDDAIDSSDGSLSTDS